ncbi:PHD finger protein-like protein [Actinidia rufa]|uniref:PHD finger protein-like protein n=1 Tax=Actinidia rufa TaxID=165716 RepID=A0A7J0G2I1_9ERIC|nr:PHD finger protein-like protein [Actinidia rufa]
MIQCCICEDWFHEEHIGLESSDEVMLSANLVKLDQFSIPIWMTYGIWSRIPRDEEGEPQYEDFICQVCSVVCSFLTLYPETIWASVRQHDATNAAKEKNVVEDMPPACSKQSVGNVVITGETSDKNAYSDQCIAGAGPSTGCLVGVDLVVAPPVLEKNSIVEYEKMAKQKRDEKLKQQEGVELNFLNKLGHVEKMEILNCIADMKNEIHSFLESYDPSKAITSEDVTKFLKILPRSVGA